MTKFDGGITNYLEFRIRPVEFRRREYINK